MWLVLLFKFMCSILVNKISYHDTCIMVISQTMYMFVFLDLLSCSDVGFVLSFCSAVVFRPPNPLSHAWKLHSFKTQVLAGIL